MTKKSGKRYGPTLREYIETYIAERDICEAYAGILRARCGKFIESTGRDILVRELKCSEVNAYLATLKDTLKPQTVAGHRRAIRCVWQAAFMDELTDEPPLRLKPIRCTLPVPQAYTLEEIKKLVDAAKRLKFYTRDGVRWADFWPALILGAFSTGLRRGDLFRVLRSDMSDDGTAIVTQHKTGYTVLVRFSAESMKYIRAINSDDGRAFPWPYHANVFVRWWRRIRKDAGVNRGEFRWLRRSAASYAEKQQPGLGTRMLGHRDPRLVVRHYADPTISAADPVTLPAVG